MVSTNPELSPVIRILKLVRAKYQLPLVTLCKRFLQSDPTVDFFLLPDLTKPFDKLRSQLLLPEICARFDDDRQDVPGGKMSPRRGSSYSAFLCRPGFLEDDS
jgi:hypothetical protein